MPTINLPNNWHARDYQQPLWQFLKNGGKRAIYTWNRRAGKDDVALHHTACSIFRRTGTYWYLLPQAAQARKAIWDAVDSHTGQRRIDWAFPKELRSKTRENEMFIEFRNGANWQVVGSDNFNSLIGSPPVGVVLSEYALSNPEAWSYLRPILRENGGWAVFNFTPRGRNHAVKMFDGARDDPDWFAQKLTADDTGVFTPEELEKERVELCRDLGEDDGNARFRQEYYCDFDAPIVGAYYAGALGKLEDAGHFGDFPYDASAPVYTASDIGRTDDLATIFYQKHHLRIHIIDCEIEAGKDASWFAKMLQDKHYTYGGMGGGTAPHTLPWDAVPETFAAPRSVIQQLQGFGIRTRIAPNVSVQAGIQAFRALLPRMYFNTLNPKVARLVEALRNYQREWDEDRKVFKQSPLHNWASHPADSGRYMALSYQEDNPSAVRVDNFAMPTLEQVWEKQGATRDSRL